MKLQGLQMHNLGRMGANSQNAVTETLTSGLASYGFSSYCGYMWGPHNRGFQSSTLSTLACCSGW